MTDAKKKGQKLPPQPYSAMGMSPGCAILFGTPFAAAGVFALLAGLGVLRTEGGGGNAPMAVVGGVGVLFGGVGLGFWAAGLRRLARSARWNAMKRRKPDEPWLWDHAWSPTGVSHSGSKPAVKSLLIAVLGTCFAAPFNWWAFWSGEGPVPVMIFAVFIDLLVAACWGGLVYTIGQGLKFGSSFLRFRTFPFFVGERVEGVLEGLDRLRGFSSLTVTLRCVEDRVVTKGNTTSVDAKVVHEETREVSPHEVPMAPGGGAGVFKLFRVAPPVEGLPVSFALPGGDLATQLSASPARRWEVVVEAELPGIDYAATFLVPVYAPAFRPEIPIAG